MHSKSYLCHCFIQLIQQQWRVKKDNESNFGKERDLKNLDGKKNTSDAIEWLE